MADTITVAALGDSLTQGYGLPRDEGFVPQMQEWLNANGADVEMLNAGVSGDTTAGGLRRVAWTLTDDVDAMIVNLGGNDFLRALDPANSRENLRGILEAAQDADVDVMLVGLAISNNYGPDYKTQFEGMYTDLAAEFDVPLYPDYFAAMNASDLPREELMQRDGIHPSAKGVAITVEDLGPKVLEWLETVQ